MYLSETKYLTQIYIIKTSSVWVHLCQNVNRISKYNWIWKCFVLFENVLYEFENVLYEFENVLYEFENVLYEFENVLYEFENVLYEFENVLYYRGNTMSDDQPFNYFH